VTRRVRGELTFQDDWGREILAEPISVEIPPASGGRVVLKVRIPAFHEPTTMTLTVLPVERPEGDRGLYDGTSAQELRTVERSLMGCRRVGCDAVILMLNNNNTGRPGPVDADPAPNGNIAIDLVNGEYQVLSGDRLAEARAASVELRLNHFYTCKNPPGGSRR
jgi:hypothetical protein